MWKFSIYSLALLLFLENKEIRKRQGKHKGAISERNNMDPEHVTSETVITGSNP